MILVTCFKVHVHYKEFDVGYLFVSLCEGPIPRPEKSYRVCVCVCVRARARARVTKCDHVQQ